MPCSSLGTRAYLGGAKVEIREYITAVVTRYKDSPAITHWQVENEPYLSLFAYEHCGELDESFLEEEIALVKSLDPTRPVLVTDSGNLGTWRGAYAHGDSFGTSVYVYFGIRSSDNLRHSCHHGSTE